MKKRIGSVLLTLALCLSLLPTAALAADETGTMPAYSGGIGTKDNPWLISSVEDLQTLASTINNRKAAGFDADCTDTGNGIPGNYHGYYFRQTTDLDLNGIENWDPIGYSEGCYFAGHYDGDGYTISNAKSTGKKDTNGFSTAGVFGWVAFGSVENLHVKNANFLAIGQNNYSYVGGIAGLCYESSIKNCSVVDSSMESKRDENNNCAGSIVGYSYNGTFEKCAAENNRVTSMAYAGGFVGEQADEKNVGKSTFTNCYTANCTVTAITDKTNGLSFAGGFVGEVTRNALTVVDCYVYGATLSTAGSLAQTVLQKTGVFAGDLWNGNPPIAATNCYFGACGTTERIGAAVEKTEDDFTNGTVAGLLGNAFAQAHNYPRFKDSPADYSAVEAAIAKANALNKDNYKDFSAVEAAVHAVVRDKKIAEQPAVDAMAKDIEGAIAALQYKDADYTKVDEALAKANALNKNSYQDFSAVEKAIADVVRDKNITEQSKVDAMAKAIEDAIAALVKKPSSSSSSRPSYSITTPDKTENGSVNISSTSAKRGSVVTITVTPDAGYVLDKLTVTDKYGKELSLTKKSDTEYTFVMPAGKVEIMPSFVKQTPSQAFVDVKTGDYFYDAVLWAVGKGITNGTSAETFSPEAPCTRAQIVTFLWRAAGSLVVNYAMDLSDVAGDAYYAEAVRWALSEGITTGTSDHTFSPDAVCTREQAVTFLWRAAGSPAVSGESAFEDVGADAYYARAVAWAAQNGVTNGISQTLFGTGSDCTRAQIVTFLYRAQQGK